LWREADERHAALAPSYFRAAEPAEGAWRDLLQEGATGVFIAERGRGKGASGLVVARVYDTPPDPALVPLRRAHVEVVVVAREARRAGIGRRLMEAVAAWARDRGAAEVVLTVWAGNAEAEAFYARLGYRVLSRVMSAKL
jgi:GNAT superfamily N-acetyltransferase